MNSLSNSDKIKALIAPKMTYLTTLLKNKLKLPVYTGVNILGIYRYPKIIGAPNTLTISSHSSNNFGPSYYTKNNTATLQLVITALPVQQNIICECCGIFGHKTDDCIIRGPKFLPPRLKLKINQFYAIRGDETTEPQREFIRQPPLYHFKYSTSHPKTSTVILATMGRLDHNAIDNGDVEVHPSEYIFESTSESIPDPDTTIIKSVDDYKMDHPLEFSHS